ncbi:UNVERIFIED_CONTAM: hypothetical protein Sindi_0939000 [Sesamum indicum]
MSTSSSRIEIFLYFGGELSSDGWSVTYDQTPIAAMRIPRSSTGFPLIEIFVETVEIQHDDAPQIGRGWGAFDSRQLVDDNSQMSQQWGEYMAMLSSQGFPSSSNYENFTGTYNSNFDAGTSNPDFGAGTSNYDTECYTPNVVSVTQELDNIELNYTELTHSHTPSTSHFIPTSAQHIAEPEDPIADSLANESDAASEPYAKFYDKNKGRLDVGMLFKNKEALIEAVKDHSIRYARREYWVPESSRSSGKYCVDIPPKLCGVDGSCEAFTNQKWEGHVKCNPSYGIKHVIQTVKDHTGYDIAYQKAWYSLKMAREMVYGTWESSVQKLPKYLGALQKYNPGTIVEWQHKARDTSTGAYVIGYVFWAFKPCIEVFQHCRNLISVDGTHLYTKYKHKMLITAAMDGNQQVLPLAFAIVDEESLLSWKWFLRQLNRHIIRGRRGICLISDRHAGITRAVRECPNFVPPNGVHGYCLRHVCSNFNSKYKNVVLKDLCWRAGSEYQIRKFNRIMVEIKSQSLEAFQWLDRIDKEKWTASHDGGWRC